jgi:hypothetical protein
VGDLVSDVAPIVARLKAAQLARDALLDDASKVLGFVYFGFLGFQCCLQR